MEEKKIDLGDNKNVVAYDIPSYKYEDNTIEAVNYGDLTKQQRNIVNSRVQNFDIPDRQNDNIRSQLSTNLLNYTPTGVYAQQVQIKRKQDNGRLNRLVDAFAGDSKVDRKIFDEGVSAMIKYIPISRYLFINRLFNRVLAGSSYSRPDVEYVQTFWIDESPRKTILNALYSSPKLDRNLNMMTIDVKGALSRSGLRPIANKGQLLMTLNPGLHNLRIDKDLLQKIWDSFTSDELKQINYAMHDLFLRESKENTKCVTDSDYERFKTSLDNMLTDIEEYNHDLNDEPYQAAEFIDRSLITTLKRIKSMFLKDYVDLNELSKVTKALRGFFDIQTNHYLVSLIDPFRAIDAKVPQYIPINTSSIKVTTVLNLTTNALGNAAFVLIPNYMANTAETGLGINNDISLDGITVSDFFVGVDNGQQQPAAIYSQFRLVSAGVKMTPIVGNLNSQGYFCIGHSYTNIRPSDVGVPIFGSSQYSIFNNIEDSYHKQSASMQSGTTLISIYRPISESIMDRFKRVETYVDLDTTFVGYVTGASPNAAAIRLEIAMNYEMLVEPEFKDYVPTSRYSGRYHDKKEAVYHVKTEINDDKVQKYANIAKLLREKFRDDKEAMDIVLEKPQIPLESTTKKESINPVKKFFKGLGQEVKGAIGKVFTVDNVLNVLPTLLTTLV